VKQTNGAEDMRAYFGEGDEFNMGFHFPLMPRLFMGLRQGLVEPILWARAHPPIPPNCQWCTFLRNHDELTLEMVTEEEREWMWQVYAPEPRMRLNLGIRRRLAPLLDNDRRKIELAHSLLLTLPGSPIIYYGDEIGMGDNIWLPDRNGVRTPMQWDSSQPPVFPPQSRINYTHRLSPLLLRPLPGERRRPAGRSGFLLNSIRRMIRLRKENRHSAGDFRWADWAAIPASRRVAAYWRTFKSEVALILNNLTPEAQQVEVSLAGMPSSLPAVLLGGPVELDTRGELLRLTLQPYQYLWLRFSQ
jgi:maltose alpha-D-glucosyltransferase/alpha-amylase